MADIIKLLPPLTFNRDFLMAFTMEEPPCVALGIAEVGGKKEGFLAINTSNILDGSGGFDLGAEVLNAKGIPVLHLIMHFPSDVFDVYLNLSAPVVKKVFNLWKENVGHFFFAFNNSGTVSAFNQSIMQFWYDYDFFGHCENANYSDDEYEGALNLLKDKAGHGIYAPCVYQDNPNYLGLDENIFEVKSNLDGR